LPPSNLSVIPMQNSEAPDKLGLGVSLAEFDRELMWRTVLLVDGILLRENKK